MKNIIDVFTENYKLGMQALRENDFKEVIRIMGKEPKSSLCYGMALGNSALAHFRLGNYEDAERLNREAIEIIESNGCLYLPSYIQFSRNYGDMLARQSRYTDANSEFNETIHLAKELMDKAMTQEERIAIELEKAHTYNSWGTSLMNGKSYSGQKNV